MALVDLAYPRFKKTLIYEAWGSVPELLVDLERMGRWDRWTERKLRWLRVAQWLSGLGMLVAFFAPLASWDQGQLDDDGAVKAACLGFSAFGVVTLALSLTRVLMGFQDLDNRRYGLVAALLQRLEVDLDPEAPVALRMDLGQPTEKHKFVHEDQRSGWECKHYADPWLDLQGRFADGTRLSVTMLERLQKRSRTRDSASGRSKTKLKQKGRSRLEVALRVKPERYPGLEAMHARAKRGTRLPPGLTLDRLEVTGERVALRVVLPGDWDAPVLKTRPGGPARTARAGRSQVGRRMAPARQDAARAATMMLLSLYQTLGAARRREKARRGSRVV